MKRVASSSTAGTFPSAIDPESMMELLLSPISLQTFKEEYFEKQVLHIARNSPDYYKNAFGKGKSDLFTLATLLKLAKNNNLEYGFNVNVCKFENGVKVDYNPKDEMVSVKHIQKLFADGCTFQFLHPQQVVDEIWMINQAMEDYFGALVGSNVYITPPNSQGLAPHNDDIEVFALQLEGSKRWKLYQPLDHLAREHSEDYDHSLIGTPTHEITLQKGDLLYFPRGVIHEAISADDTSIHLTISTYQNNSWGHFILAAAEEAIEKLFVSDLEFRQGLPLNYLNHIGSAIVGHENQKQEFSIRYHRLVDKLVKQLLNAEMETADAMSIDFMSNRLPPFGSGPSAFDGKLKGSMLVRLRINCLRVMMRKEEDELCVFVAFSSENERSTHMDGRYTKELEEIKLPMQCMQPLTQMMQAHPCFLRVSDILCEKQYKQFFLDNLSQVQLLEIK